MEPLLNQINLSLSILNCSSCWNSSVNWIKYNLLITAALREIHVTVSLQCVLLCIVLHSRLTWKVIYSLCVMYASDISLEITITRIWYKYFVTLSCSKSTDYCLSSVVSLHVTVWLALVSPAPKINHCWFLVSEVRDEVMAVASAGPCANHMHLTWDNHQLITQVLQAWHSIIIIWLSQCETAVRICAFSIFLLIASRLVTEDRERS